MDLINHLPHLTSLSYSLIKIHVFAFSTMEDFTMKSNFYGINVNESINSEITANNDNSSTSHSIQNQIKTSSLKSFFLFNAIY